VLRGVVIVPNGVTLTINEGCHVSAAGIPVNATLPESQNWRIEIEAGGQLLIAGATLDGAGSRWGGIRNAGKCIITGSFICGAVQGLACDVGAECTVDHTSFMENIVGVQALGSYPLLSECNFESNTGYAIKEDAGGQPKLQGCKFIGNTYTYYRYETGTIIDVSGINLLPNNIGNE
jgi:hypothetical protein